MRTAIALCAFASLLPAQNFVECHVVDALTGLPVPGAYVSVGRPMTPPVPFSDAAGVARVPVTPDQRMFVTYAAGYLTDSRWTPANSASATLRIPLIPAAALSGSVVDQDGVPVAHAAVETLGYQGDTGTSKLVRGRWVYTDEKGAYRIAGLAAGRYYLRVKPQPYPQPGVHTLAEWDLRYTPRFFPSVADFSHAETIEVKAGEQRSLPVIRLARLEGVTVSGRVDAPAAARVGAHIHSLDVLDFHADAKMLPDGSFTISHVPPGAYVVDTLPQFQFPRAGQPAARAEIEVGAADVNGVILTTKPFESIDLPGKIVFRDRDRPDSVQVFVRGDQVESYSASAAADGSFTLKGLLPQHYTITVQSTLNSKGWTGRAVSAELAGREVLGAGFDVGLASPGTLTVTLAAPFARITGTVTSADGQPAADTIVTLIPLESGPRTVGVTDSAGRFESNLWTTGDYRVYVAASADPGYLAAHAADYPLVHILPGENQAPSLKIPAK